LANRAEISRTALYQIESGKTGLPRAGTLRRIAVALEVPMEDLLGNEAHSDHPSTAPGSAGATRRPRALYDWVPGDGVPLTLSGGSSFKAVAAGDESRFALEPPAHAKNNGQDSIYLREGELISKLHDLIHSPIGDGVARIVEELHLLLPRARASV
jgi:transcriptional regulator with XRE-family HTH domain